MRERLFFRLDNRLLHGQVVQFWIPYLGIERLVVTDDGVCQDTRMQTIYRLALPKIVQLSIVPVSGVSAILAEQRDKPTMILVKDIPTTERVLAQDNVPVKRIAIGNIHASMERTRVTDAVYLSEREMESLVDMHRRGLEIVIETFPRDVLRFIGPEDGGPGWAR